MVARVSAGADRRLRVFSYRCAASRPPWPRRLRPISRLNLLTLPISRQMHPLQSKPRRILISHHPLVLLRQDPPPNIFFLWLRPNQARSKRDKPTTSLSDPPAAAGPSLSGPSLTPRIFYARVVAAGPSHTAPYTNQARPKLLDVNG